MPTKNQPEHSSPLSFTDDEIKALRAGKGAEVFKKARARAEREKKEAEKAPPKKTRTNK